jgi:hypothetical protein
MNPTCLRGTADPSVVFAGCNANCNGQSTLFEGPLFDTYNCVFCQQSRYCALLHICDSLRLDVEKDRMCIDCVIKCMCTGKDGTQLTYCPTRHQTPLITAVMGISLLDEIKKIVMQAYHISVTQYKEWTYVFEFEKTITKQSHRTDLIITIKRNHQIMWYVLGTFVLCLLGLQVRMWLCIF